MREPGFVDGFIGGVGHLFGMACIALTVIQFVIKPLFGLF
jgi:hypothetical protein